MQVIGPHSELREETIACMTTNPQGELIDDKCLLANRWMEANTH